MPGKVIQSMQRAGVTNPVFCLDEVDKMSMDFRGDPSAALLEVLDPEQNSAFNDHYLDLDYDLSQVFFITTANHLHGIPIPLQDRMEIIHLSGYTEEDKLKIAQKYLLPKQLEENGFQAGDIGMTDGAILEIVRRYTKEAGVRELERTIASLCRRSPVIGSNGNSPINGIGSALTRFLSLSVPLGIATGWRRNRINRSHHRFGMDGGGRRPLAD